ncbi:hypothetical protein P692DRAFT_20830064 [Suillus brevipes Sb2]|nr:hypothetical protein P692DRAFT_20830064 [Suillus brevipes Sb2]
MIPDSIHAHFMMPIAGTATFGFGLMTTLCVVPPSYHRTYLTSHKPPIQLYLVDTFTYAATATAAASVSRLYSRYCERFLNISSEHIIRRSVHCSGLHSPLFGQQMFAALGYGWGKRPSCGFCHRHRYTVPILCWRTLTCKKLFDTMMV